MRPEDVLVLPLDLLQFDLHQAAVETVLKHFKQVRIAVRQSSLAGLNNHHQLLMCNCEVLVKTFQTSQK